MVSRPSERRHGYHPTSLEVAQRHLADATTALRVAEAADKGIEAAAWGTVYLAAFVGLKSISLPRGPPSVEDLKAAIEDEIGMVYRTVAWPIVAAAHGVGAAGEILGTWLDNLTLSAAGKVHHRMEKERQNAAVDKPWTLSFAEAALIAAITVIALKVLMGGVRVRPG